MNVVARRFGFFNWGGGGGSGIHASSHVSVSDVCSYITNNKKVLFYFKHTCVHAHARARVHVARSVRARALRVGDRDGDLRSPRSLVRASFETRFDLNSVNWCELGCGGGGGVRSEHERTRRGRSPRVDARNFFCLKAAALNLLSKYCTKVFN